MTALYHTGKLTLQEIVERMSIKPRMLLGLAPECLRVGAEANLILVDTEKVWTVDPAKLHSRSCNTAFRGMELRGKVVMTITGGEIRFEEQN